MTNERADNQPAPTREERRAVRALLRRLGRANAVRRFAERLLEPDDSPPEPVAPLLETLCNPSLRRWRERAVAAWAIGYAPLSEAERAEAIGALLNILERGRAPDGERAARCLGRAGLLALPVSLLIGLLMALLPIPGGGGVALLRDWAAYLACFWAFFLLLVAPHSYSVDDDCTNRVRAAAVGAVGRLRASEGIGALAEAVYDSAYGVRQAARPALCAVLSALTPECCGELSAQAAPALRRALEDQDDEAAVLAILAALEKAGDGRAALAVERMAMRARTEAIRNASARILPALQERRRMALLLRAGIAPSEETETLLRPVTEAEAAPELLLRAAPQKLTPDFAAGEQAGESGETRSRF